MSQSHYERVHGSRLYEEVASQIQEDILNGTLRPGDKLPSEHTLAKEFGVSRTVLREAIQSLQSRGLVKVVHGSGMFVSEPTADAIVEALSTLFQFKGASSYAIHEAREILEIEIAALAAERASEDDKAELLSCLAWMEKVRDSAREYVELDLLFHGILTRATRNEVFLVLLEPMIDLLRRSRLKAIQAPGGIENSFRGHKAIYECIKRGDGEGARAAMRDHLREVRERLESVDKADSSR